MPESKRAREAIYAPQYHEDLRHWIATNRRLALRLLDLEEAVMRDPLQGIGKPEPLRHLGADVWSRRLDDEHRLVYRVERERIVFLRSRGHYDR
ncbi:MAG: Txe/YoeB family addiction module toxin [Chloroflexi bacterium]|nr:Txe/YoeB family addiction module toxin [Chloroflexota bacterium]